MTDAKMISLLIKLYYYYYCMGLLCLFLELMQKKGEGERERDSQKEVMGNREGYLSNNAQEGPEPHST